MSHEMFVSGTEFERKMPQRPLGPLSNFIIEQMPTMLSGIRAGEIPVDDLAMVSGELVDSVAQTTVDPLIQPRQSSRGVGGQVSTYYPGMLAQLDAALLEAAIVHSGGIPPDSLIHLVDVLSEASDQPPVITYEGITYINPGGDIRTFTLDQQGNPHPAEAHFYKGHPRIDAYLDSAAVDIQSVCCSLTDPVVRDALSLSPQELLEKSLGQLKQANQLMAQYRSPILTEPFKVFRRYVTSHPIRGLKGPSGAFSSGIPVLDIQIAGKVLPSFALDYIRDNFQYFPRQGRRDIAIALDRAKKGLSLNALISESDPVFEVVERLKQQMRIFRGYHSGAVNTQLKDVVEGTAGEEIGPFLKKRQELHK